MLHDRVCIILVIRSAAKGPGPERERGDPVSYLG
jgi:hypothetical protein